MYDFASTPIFFDAPVAYSVIDRDGNQLAANRQFWDLFGYEPGTPLSVRDLTATEFRDDTEQYLDRIRSSDTEFVVTEKRYVRADGSQFLGRLTAKRILAADGTTQMLGIIQDIDEQRELQDELRESALAQSKFVAQVSHELRNPLHTISGMAELLADAGLDIEHRQKAELILREAQGLTSIVSDLLDIGRIDAGNFDVERSPFAVRKVVDRSARSAQAAGSARGLTVNVVVDDAVPIHVLGDERRVGQILDNLLGNAVKFTMVGTVTLTVSAPRGASHDANTVQFRVSDTGPGIPADFIDGLYEPFRRVNESTTGAGLGLAISLRLAESMGGTLQLASTGYDGTEFVLALSLPVVEAPPAETQAPGAGTQASGRGVGRILVVEDNPETQMLASAQLTRLGYDHVVAGDGYEALDLSEKETYAAILMDWHLPGMDGLETTRRMRQREEREGRARVPIVSVTARAMAADIEACLKAGADDFVAKPASLGRIAEVLEQWVGGSHEQIDADEPSAGELFVALREDLGEDSIVCSLGETFLSELPERIEAITSAADGDERAELAAHTLASTSAMFGAAELAAIAREIEDAARSSQLITSEHKAQLVAAATTTTTAMTAVLASLRGAS